jgi:methyl-accepting chemotaxis protein
MEFSDENIDLSNYPTPAQFTERLQTLQQQLPAILEDFKKYYVFYNKNPEFDEYKQMFENMKANLNKINSDLFVLSNDVSSSTDDLNKKLFNLNTLIEQEKQKNRELKIKLGIINRKSAASDEMITNFREIYESEYLRNWGLFGCIILGGFVIKNIYTKTSV